MDEKTYLSKEELIALNQGLLNSHNECMGLMSKSEALEKDLDVVNTAYLKSRDTIKDLESKLERQTNKASNEERIREMYVSRCVKLEAKLAEAESEIVDLKSSLLEAKNE